MQWGLAQTHCVTVPLRITLFPMSYAAAPWCANSGSEKIETPIPRARHIKNLPFKSHLLFGGAKTRVFRLGPTTSFQTGRDSKGRIRPRQPTPIPTPVVNFGFVSPRLSGKPRANPPWVTLQSLLLVRSTDQRCRIEDERTINTV